MLFKEWLQEYLTKLNNSVDGDLLDYIIGLLDDLNEDEEEVKESLAGLLEQLVNSDLDCHCTNIVKKHKELTINHGDNPDNSKLDSNKSDVDAVTAQMKEIINLDKEKIIPYRKQGSKKKAIMLRGNEGEVSTTDEESDSGEEELPQEKSTAIASRFQLKDLDEDQSETDEEAESAIKNMSGASNREQVIKNQNEQREKQRAENAKKKETDRTNRTKQLEQQKARKESEKKRTQKGERRR